MVRGHTSQTWHHWQCCLQNRFPDILAVVQVALEGAISKGAARAALAAGQLPQGDLLPWLLGQSFQDDSVPRLSGARVVRIAAHPALLGGGYGSRAMRQLERYFGGQLVGAVYLEVCLSLFASAYYATMSQAGAAAALL